MNPRYIDAPLVDLDPEPEPGPRTLTPRYIEHDPDGAVPKRGPSRTPVPASAAGLPAYRLSGSAFWAPLGTVAPDQARGLFQFDPAALDDYQLPKWPPDPVHIDLDVTKFGDAIRDLVEKLGIALSRVGPQVMAAFDGLREAGLLPDDGPTDPKARALWLRQHRNTGPSRDVVHQPRPRSIPTRGAHR